MITEEVKAMAIARLQRGIDPQDISDELDIPQKLIKEWRANLNPNQMISLAANMHASEEQARGVVTLDGKPLEDAEATLKTRLEGTAIQIVDETKVAVSTNNLVKAKTLQLCADTISKLYATFITKGSGAAGGNIPNSQTAFQRLMRD